MGVQIYCVFCDKSDIRVFVILELKSHPRERIIEEVMGRYTDVTPIEKVSYTILSNESLNIEQRKI